MPSIELTPSEDWPEELAKAVTAAPLPGLDDLPKCNTTSAAAKALAGDGHLESEIIAGLWLLAGELDRSHTISQSIEAPEGSFLHGIMHRREGDFSNAKYWFRRSGVHEVHHLLARQILQQQATFQLSGLPLKQLTHPETLANELVDLCQQAVSGKPQWTEDLQRICWWELELLLFYCIEKQPALR